MITIGDKEYRNLEEQVLKNMEDIEVLQSQSTDILNSDNTFTGVNNFEGNLYKLTEGGAPQFAANNVMTAISFYDENDDQTGTVGVTSSGVKIKVDNNVIEVSDIGIDISAPGSGVGIHDVNTPEDDYDVANKEYVDSIITDTVAGYLPLSGGTMTGDLLISNYKKLQFASGSYFQNEANTRTALHGILKMSDNSIDMNSHSITNVTNPTNAQDASTKKYVDDAVGNCVQKTTTANILYGTDTSGQPTNRTVTPSVVAGTVVSRASGGFISVPETPTANSHAASKAYVDSVASAAGSSYLVDVTNNLTQADVKYGWKIGKMIVFYGQFTDDLNTGMNAVTVASGDTINYGYIQCGDETMEIEGVTGRFDEETTSFTNTSTTNRFFSGVLFLT